jgi:hypothetical protein
MSGNINADTSTETKASGFMTMNKFELEAKLLAVGEDREKNREKTND